MDEFDLYEAEHADDFDALDDLQIDIPGIFNRTVIFFHVSVRCVHLRNYFSSFRIFYFSDLNNALFFTFSSSEY